jgi:hypothetical protein
VPFLVIIYTVAICYMSPDGVPIESQHRNASLSFLLLPSTRSDDGLRTKPPVFSRTEIYR